MHTLRYVLAALLLGLVVEAEAQSPAFPIDPSTVALYTFDGTDPDTTFDVSGNGHHAFNEGTTSVPGRHGNARQFDGEDDRIDVDAARAALQSSAAWTLEYIARSESGSQVPELVNHVCRGGWWLGPRSGTSRYGIKTTSGGSCGWTTEEFLPGLLDLEWHYYALAWEGSTLSFYRDGMLRDSAPGGGAFQGSGGSRAWIGHSDSGAGSYTSGLADELRVSGVARSADEIRNTAIALGFLDTTPAEPGADLPRAFALHAAYPNPFNPQTTLRYDVPEAGRVRLAVYDALGREVARLVDAERPAGRHEAVFDGAGLASGLYLVRMTAEDFTETRTITLLR